MIINITKNSKKKKNNKEGIKINLCLDIFMAKHRSILTFHTLNKQKKKTNKKKKLLLNK